MYDLFMKNARRSPTLGNRVRERRQALGLSQREVARRAGVARQTVNKVERIEGYQVTTVVCLRLAQTLGADVAELFFEKDAEQAGDGEAA